MMSKFYLLALWLLAVGPIAAQHNCQELKSWRHQTASQAPPSINNNAKSDTFDILHYALYLDFSQLPSRHLRGRAEIMITPKTAHGGVINLDLLQLQADSLFQDGQPISFTHNDTIIRANLIGTPAPTDTFTISVYYHGSPPGDLSGWGGWHQQNGYFFNLGVGFAANPHTYGRAWHPCFDNFVERSSYDFYVTTRAPNRPYCNGLRISETALAGDTLLTHWQMTDPIPTYLASVAISNYIEITDTVQGLQAVIPIQWMARGSDSSNVANKIPDLKSIFHSFENAFGPYNWQRVGYAMTTVGAMEHATSIHITPTAPRSITAHELAHHWWGNLVTCQTDADMWINEGMAEYCSHLYLEDLVGRQRYLNEVRKNAYFVLEEAHVRDDGYRAIQGLDHENVYGAHVYQKGAMVAHNLRGYLGDSLFFNGLTELLDSNKFDNLTSIEFRDQLSQITGLNLTDFFENWVFTKGFPAVWIDSLHISTTPNEALVRLRQGTHHAPQLYQAMPVSLTFMDVQGNTHTRQMNISADTASMRFKNLPFVPLFVVPHYSSQILTGDMYDEYTTSPFVEKYSKIKLTPVRHNSSRVIAMHHWDGPQGKKPAWADYRLSTSHFWSIYTTDTSDRFSARINFDGDSTQLDFDLLRQTGDSLQVLYRPHPGDEWRLWPYQDVQDFGTPGNIVGFITLDSVKAGDYVLANTSENIGLKEAPEKQGSLDIYPNPTKNRLNFKFPDDYPSKVSVKIMDVSGKLVYDKTHHLNEPALRIKLDKLRSEYVIVSVGDYQEKIWLTR